MSQGSCKKWVKFVLFVLLAVSLVCLVREISIIDDKPSIVQQVDKFSTSINSHGRAKLMTRPNQNSESQSLIATNPGEFETTTFSLITDDVIDVYNFSYTYEPGYIPFTSINNTKVVVMETEDNIHKGDTLHLILTTHDATGLPRMHGGDMWYVVMYNDVQKMRSAGLVRDQGNGTYIVTFYAAWKGYAAFDITLVHPAESTKWLREVWWPAEQKLNWTGHYRKQEKTVQSTCILETNATDGTFYNKCTYANELVLGSTAFLCDKPPEPMTCDYLYSSNVNFLSILEGTKRFLNGSDAILFNNNYTMVTKTKVAAIVVKEKSVQLRPLHLPECTDINRVRPHQVHGYWMGNQWNSLICDMRVWERAPLQDIRRCLRKRHLVLLGDSVKQFFDALLELSGFLRSRKTKTVHSVVVETDDTTFTLASPPWPIASTPITFDVTRNEVNVIEGLDTENCNYVIVISSYTHFLQWPRASYIERMRLVRESLLRLRERCPETMIVIKGTKPREHFEPDSEIHSSDFILLEMNKVLKEIYKDMYFLDVWDMNLSFPAPNRSSMPIPLIRQEVSMFLSHICGASHSALRRT
ncbi:NXPE family member 4-like [Saccoglossus kowalevskii]|uniref:NXPE family member 4-like n=1 Tax=Saccoglossus kowalevskii TaxID=10224 RepID=A0ABM0LXH2_SACKO|nr:PREDICTED: NXPE family member 4-like [Saccoglossus kowalevskii]